MTIEKAIARAWIDADFKTRLVTRAHDALAEVGVEVPAGTNLRVLENTADTQHIVLPAAPGAADDVSMDDLERVAGGTILTGIYTVC